MVVYGLGTSVVRAQVHNLTQGTDHSTIQEAIDEADNGDEIEVDPGNYVENVNFRAKDITLRSTDPLDLFVVATTAFVLAALPECQRSGSTTKMVSCDGLGVPVARTVISESTASRGGRQHVVIRRTRENARMPRPAIERSARSVHDLLLCKHLCGRARK